MWNLYLIHIIALIWLSFTGLVDFFIVPKLFAAIPDFFLAGRLGIQYFKTLNTFEFLASSLSLVLILKLPVKKKTLTCLCLALWGISSFYFFYLNDQITHASLLWEKAESLKVVALNGIEDVQQYHQFYHSLYIQVDSLKILLLMLLIGVSGFQLGLFKKKKME